MSGDSPEPSRTVIPSLNIQPSDTPPDIFATNYDHFKSIPWTASLLAQPGVVPFLLQARNPGAADQDQFFGTTLNSPTGLPYMLSFFKGTPDNTTNPKVPVKETFHFFEIGHGLSGVPNVLHGGITMSMVDEAMGTLTELNFALGKEGDAFQGMAVTGTLETKFLRPIFTGTVVVIRAWMEDFERRKTRVHCEVRDEEGQELARCSSIWVVKRASKM